MTFKVIQGHGKDNSGSIHVHSEWASLSCCASTQSQLVWVLGICCCRPNCLELPERWSAWSDA